MTRPGTEWNPFSGTILLLLFVGWCTVGAVMFRDRIRYNGGDRFPQPLSASNPGGDGAILRHGLAIAPPEAPAVVQRVIWVGNALTRTPYKRGGGRSSFWDSGYDSPGAISLMLGYNGLIPHPLGAAEFREYGEPGPGRWISIYASRSHAFAVIAGLRFDTMSLQHSGNGAPA